MNWSLFGAGQLRRARRKPSMGKMLAFPTEGRAPSARSSATNAHLLGR
jgi:hypothetical protein